MSRPFLLLSAVMSTAALIVACGGSTSDPSPSKSGASNPTNPGSANESNPSSGGPAASSSSGGTSSGGTSSGGTSSGGTSSGAILNDAGIGEPTCVAATNTLCERACACTSNGAGKCALRWGGIATETHDSLSDCQTYYAVMGCSQTQKIDGPACKAAAEVAACAALTDGNALVAPEECRPK